MQSFLISLTLVGLLVMLNGCGGDSSDQGYTPDPLAILDTYPADAAIEVSPLFTEISVTFNYDIDPTTLSASNFQVHDATNTSVAGNLNAERDRVIFRVTDMLHYSQDYTATISGVITAVNGSSFDADISIDFSTQAQQPNMVFLTSVVGTAVPAKPTFGLVHISAQRHHRAGQCERAVTTN